MTTGPAFHMWARPSILRDANDPRRACWQPRLPASVLPAKHQCHCRGGMVRFAGTEGIGVNETALAMAPTEDPFEEPRRSHDKHLD